MQRAKYKFPVACLLWPLSACHSTRAAPVKCLVGYLSANEMPLPSITPLDSLTPAFSYVLVKEKTILRVLNDPFQAFPEALACNSTALNDGPSMCLDRIQLEPLEKTQYTRQDTGESDHSYFPNLLVRHAATNICLIREDKQTGAHQTLSRSVLLRRGLWKGPTSSSSNPASSSLQSSMRRRSVASTTHIKASVFSK